jgi:hypothetical protein
MGTDDDTDDDSAPKTSGLARGSAPTKSHKNAPGRNRFSGENQPKKRRGRPRGSRNKLTKSMTELLLRAAAEVGDSTQPGRDGKGRVLGYFKVSAILERRTYLALLGRGLPLYLHAQVSHKPILTREEAIAESKQRGLPEGIIDLLEPVEYVLEGPDPYGNDDANDPEAAK